MKIFHIKSDTNSLERDQRFLDLVRMLAGLGISQRVLMPADENMEAELTKSGVPFVIGKFSGLFDLRTRQAAQSVIAEFSPQIIQLHSGSAASFAEKISVNAVRVGFRENGPSITNNLPGIVLASGYARSDKKMNYDIFEVPPLVMAPANDSVATKTAFGIDQKTPLIGTMIDWTAEYEVEPVLSAIREIPGLHFWIMGRGPQDAVWQQKAAKQKVQDRVHFIADPEDWQRRLAVLDLCVIPHRTEGVDRLTLQAWADNTPVLSGMEKTRSPVTHQADGWLVPGSDVMAWRAAISKLIGDPALRKKLAAAGRRKYDSAYAPALTVKSYLQAYETALKIKMRQ